MSEYEQLIGVISLTMGVAWASGINLYAAVLVLGLGGATGYIELPPTLAVVQDPMVIAAAGIMYCIEFFADKTPGVDTGWDAIHTFIRIPAGAMLAAGSVGEVAPAMQIAAGLVGGSMAAATHAAKASSRVLINTSPEPVSNWSASIAEDLAVIGGLWLALNHPLLFLVLLALFIALLVWMLPRLWRGARAVLRKIGEWLGVVDKERPSPAIPDPVDDLVKLRELRASGALTPEEFEQAKKRLLNTGATSAPAGQDDNRGAEKP